MIRPEDVLLQSAEAILQIGKNGGTDSLIKQGIIVALGDFFLSAQKVDQGALIDAVTGALAAAEK